LIADADGLQQGEDALAPFSTGHTLDEQQRILDVLVRGQDRHQVELLKDEADGLAAEGRRPPAVPVAYVLVRLSATIRLIDLAVSTFCARAAGQLDRLNPGRSTEILPSRISSWPGREYLPAVLDSPHHRVPDSCGLSILDTLVLRCVDEYDSNSHPSITSSASGSFGMTVAPQLFAEHGIHVQGAAVGGSRGDPGARITLDGEAILLAREIKAGNNAWTLREAPVRSLLSRRAQTRTIR
jgi:hypothetical protein